MLLELEKMEKIPRTLKMLEKKKVGLLMAKPEQVSPHVAVALYGLGSNRPQAKKKKKRKPRKKKTTTTSSTAQTSPPRIPVSQLFPNQQYPEGQVVEYANANSYRTTNEEKRHLDRMNNDFLNEYRQAAEVHRQVRQWAQKNIKPGQTLTEIAEGIEDGVRFLTDHQGLEEGDNLKGGMGFPTGLSLNNCAAHYTPNSGNKMILTKDDVMKVDFGVHINGRILDSAFTMSFDPVYDNLLAAAKDATNTGVRVSRWESAFHDKLLMIYRRQGSMYACRTSEAPYKR